MRRRLDLAAALVHRPPVLFLDEPTTGLDPQSRNDLWDVVRGLVADGTTVLLTTQYLEEADLLADRIVVIDRGAVLVEGTSAELKRRLGATVRGADDGRTRAPPPSAAGVLEGLDIGAVTRDGAGVRLSTADGTRGADRRRPRARRRGPGAGGRRGARALARRRVPDPDRPPRARRGRPGRATREEAVR